MAGFRQMLNSNRSCDDDSWYFNQNPPQNPGIQQHGPYMPIYPPSASSFHFVPSGLTPPGRPLDLPGPSGLNQSRQLTSAGPEKKPEKKTSPASGGKRTTWSSTEVKILIQAYRDNIDYLQSSKSSKGKKNVWDVLYQEFLDGCSEAKIKTNKTLAQAKEKWRALFDKYKAVCDNNSQTGREKMEFEFFYDIDEFMGSSDKVHPRFTKETAVISKGDHNSDVSDDEDADGTNALKGKGKRPKNSGGKTGGKETAENEPKSSGGGRKKKQKISEENDNKLIDLLEAQQEVFKQSQEQDEKAMETLLKFQTDAEKRHQEFMLAVFGKLADMMSSKK